MNNQRIFISYKSDDEYFARGMVSSLESMGLLCWIASRDINQGAAFNREIPPAIEKAELIILILTKKADESEEIQREMALATQAKKQIIPLNVDGCKPVHLNYWLATIQWLNFSDYGGFDAIAKIISSKCFGINATPKNRPCFRVKVTRYIPLYSGLLQPISQASLSNFISGIGLRGSPVLQCFNDGFTVLTLREELTYADPIDLLQDRRQEHLKIIGSKDCLSDFIATKSCSHALFLDRPPKMTYVMSIYQILSADGLRDTDIYAICEPSLVGITDDPNQEIASKSEAVLSLANLKSSVALSQLTPIATKNSCFYVGWSNVILVDQVVDSPDYKRLEHFEMELQKIWFQLDSYEVLLDNCIMSPQHYDLIAVKREINRAKLQLSIFKKIDSVGSAHINALKQALFITCKIKDVVASIDEKMEML